MLLRTSQIVPILMRRDDLTVDEAIDLVAEAEDMLNEAFCNGDDPEEVMLEVLGLEPDYLL